MSDRRQARRNPANRVAPVKPERGKSTRRLHLGCGKVHIPGFYHIDMQSFSHVDHIGLLKIDNGVSIRVRPRHVHDMGVIAIEMQRRAVVKGHDR